MSMNVRMFVAILLTNSLLCSAKFSTINVPDCVDDGLKNSCRRGYCWVWVVGSPINSVITASIVSELNFLTCLSSFFTIWVMTASFVVPTDVISANNEHISPKYIVMSFGELFWRVNQRTVSGCRQLIALSKPVIKCPILSLDLIFRSLPIPKTFSN